MKQVFVFIALFFTVQMAPAAEKPTDFAYGITIDATGSEALYDVTLPPSVYQGVTRRDLADVRVFNGVGEVVAACVAAAPHGESRGRCDAAADVVSA